MKIFNNIKLSKPSVIFLTLVTSQNFADKLTGPIFIIFLAEHNLSSTQIGILLGIATWVTGVLDFPTGNLSDIKGRKKSSILGFISFGIGLIIYGSGNKFWHFAIGQSMIGFGFAFVSGAIVAWYLDSLNSIGVENESKKVFALSNGISYFFNTLAGVCATLLLFCNLRLPFFVAGGTVCLAALVCSIFMEENYGEKDQKYLQFIKNTWNTFISNSQVKMFTLIQVVSGISFVYFVLSWQRYLTNLGLAKEYLGIIFAFMMLAISLTSFILARYIDDKNCPNFAITSMALMACAFFLMFLSKSIVYAVSSCILFQIALSIKMTSFTIWINNIIPRNSRAAILSTISTFENIGLTIMFALVGFLIDIVGLSTGFIFASTAALVSTLFFFKLKKSKQNLEM